MDLSVIVLVCLPFFLWMVFWSAMPKCPYQMDGGGIRGMFLGILPLYHRFFYAISVFSMAGAFVAWKLGINDAVLPLFVAMFYALAFIGLLTVFYEAYQANSSSYTALRYSLILSLAFSSFLLFIVGISCLVPKIIAAR